MQYPTGSFIDGLTNDWWDRPAGHGGRAIPPPPRAAASTSSSVAHHLNPAAYLLGANPKRKTTYVTGGEKSVRQAHRTRMDAHPLLRLKLVRRTGDGVQRRSVCVHQHM